MRTLSTTLLKKRKAEGGSLPSHEKLLIVDGEAKT